MNVTYHGGQIKERFRGDMALFMSLDSDKQELRFEEYPLGTEEYLAASSNLVHTRTYLGVNGETMPALEKRFAEAIERREFRWALFGIDVAVVEHGVAQHQYEAFIELQARSKMSAIEWINSIGQ